ncbi:salivaricin M family lantibiotic [Streptococcus oralis]|uniref:salivaricin M family lantibiotic n=1 Tax=Streptococcus oralis TaxID=1303 RepID=UPI00066A59AF|nr:salivaricin M family lantibiotic [Streptococcus oralis]
MVKDAERPVIDSLDFEVANQELAGKSGSGWFTAIQLTLAGRCGNWFTGSFECTSNNVKCG